MQFTEDELGLRVKCSVAAHSGNVETVLNECEN